jgi:SOS response associated peptidase (SRAP)/NUMOD3 motif
VPFGLQPQYNVAPTQSVLSVRLDAEGRREAVNLRWGLVPFWADDLKIGQKLINARGETVFEKPSFRDAGKKRRCLIAVDGFYEWRPEGGKKQPSSLRVDADALTGETHSMPDPTRLLFGPYTAPPFAYGEIVRDEVRGDVEIWGLTDAPIPWPIGKIGSAKSLVVYAGLADAVRNESNVAVCHWWGIMTQTVTKWRKALGVGMVTAGTRKLFQDAAAQPAIVEALKKAHSKARDPQRRENIAAARRGTKRPAHVVEAVRKAHLGKKHSAEARQKMSEAQRKRGARPPKAGRPWTVTEDQLVEQLPPAEAARQTGRSLSAVYTRRPELKAGRANRAHPGPTDTSRS